MQDDKRRRLVAIKSAASNPAVVQYVDHVRTERLSTNPQSVNHASTSTQSTRNTVMANDPKSQSNKSPSTSEKPSNGQKPAGGAPPPNVKAGEKPTKSASTEPGDKPKKAKRQRVRLASSTEPGMWCRMFKDVYDKFGAPLDSKGQPMVLKAAVPFGQSSEQRAERKAEKEAEKAKFDAMSDEEKLSYAKAKREKKQAEGTAKKEAERNALIAQIKAEIAAGRL